MDESVQLAIELIMETAKYAKEQQKTVKETKGWSKAIGSAVSAGVMGAVAAIGLLVAALALVASTAFTFANDTEAAMNRFQAQTGAATSEMGEFKDIAMGIYTSNWGESIGDVAESMAIVKQITGETGDALEDTTRKALIMRDVFGKDIQESVRAVDTAVVNFGTTGAHAFDLVTATIQKVGDPADDLLDTVNEYSPIFAEAGYTADEMFGVLQAGLQAGARNFDVVADAVKEFQIRLIDGSDTTAEALNTLLVETGKADSQYVALNNQINATAEALEDNAAALENAEGAYAASKAVVDDLSQALGEARRELDELSRPNLAGMEEYDDQLFELEQQSKQAKLALLDMVPDTDEYQAAQQQLDAINKEIDRVSLQRDLTFDRQLRDIEKAATDGLEPVMTYDEVMGQIGEKRSEIDKLQKSFADATTQMDRDAAAYEKLQSDSEILTANLEGYKKALEALGTPADEFLSHLYDGTMSGKEAMDQVNNMLRSVDQETRDAVGPMLYGTKWEDLKDTIILSMGEGVHYAQQVEGATMAAGDAIQQGLGPSFESLKRDAMAALEPIGQVMVNLAGQLLPYVIAAFTMLAPYLQQAAEWLGANIPLAIETLSPYVQDLKAVFGEFAVNIMPVLIEGWNTLYETFTTSIQPALADLMVSIAELTGESTGWDGILKILKVTLSLIGPIITGIVAVLKVWWEIIGAGIAVLSSFINSVRLVYDGIVSMTNAVKDAVKWVKDLLSMDWGKIADSMPDWLIPHSPTPFEKGLRGIADAVKGMPDLQFSMGANMGNLAGAGADAGGGISGPVKIYISGAGDPNAVAAAVDRRLQQRFKQTRRK